MIIDHNNRLYQKRWKIIGKNRYNGAFYYSKEIVRNIIPLVDTDRNWITVNIPGQGCDHSIVFIHNNLHPENYEWLKQYKDVVLVCGIKETIEKVNHIGKAIYLPLSIDTEYVKQFKLPKDKRSGVAFVGRPAKRTMDGITLPDRIKTIEGTPRASLLMQMAQLESAYCVGRTALEAKALGVKVLPYDERFPKVSVWKVLDNKDAAKILQEELDKIDKPTVEAEKPKKKRKAKNKADGEAVGEAVNNHE